MTLYFATTNAHKVAEARAIIAGTLAVHSLSDLGYTGHLPEDHHTLRENAYQKASYVLERYGVDCFAEDTGLFVSALDGAPGARSARYAKEGAAAEENQALLLKNMANVQNREAFFRSVIALFTGGSVYFFAGEVKGSIALAPMGTSGFGYDAIFVPAGYHRSFAALTAAEKNEISHRRQVLKALVKFLGEQV